MPGVRFLRAELEYGCHVQGSIDILPKDAPVVISGPNGSGKTTFLEALVRTMFGFNRMQDEEKRCLESRIPWSGEGCAAEVVVARDGGGRFRFRREFDGSTVRIEPLDGGEPWVGDGNPASRNQEAREFRRRLAELFGFSEIGPYQRTACISQGKLTSTALGEDLLQIAAGGYGGVDEALDRLEEEHRALTVRPIADDASAGRNPRQIETIDREIEDLRERLAVSEAAFRKRAPILAEMAEAEERIETLEAEVAELESALGPLNEKSTILERIERLEERARTLRRTQTRIEAAAGTLRDASREIESAEDRYPADFPERTGRLQDLWSGQEELRQRGEETEKELTRTEVPSPWTAPLAGLVAALPGVLLIVATPYPWLGGALVAAGALVAGFLWVRRRAGSRRRNELRAGLAEISAEREKLEQRLSRQLVGVPRAESLGPATLEERKREFEARREARRRVETAKAALAGAVESALEPLGEAAPQDLPDSPLEKASAIVEACEEAREAVRTSIAQARIEQKRVETSKLPEDVEATPAAVSAALEERRGRLRERREEVLRLRTRLVDEGSGDESPVALRDRIEEMEERRARVESEAAALEAAYALVRDSYQNFRERDQERFLEEISTALAGLGEGTLGPIEASGDLSEARILLHGRPVPLSSPPLSYGEFHAALFAIRLGASDFLARAGVCPPLIVDEPFAFLDLDRARELWGLLSAIAGERQVFVATQEKLTLEALGITPDLEFERPGGVRERPGG